MIRGCLGRRRSVWSLFHFVGVMMLNESMTVQHRVVNVWPGLMGHPDFGVEHLSSRFPGLFRELPEAQSIEILSCAVLRKFKRGEFIFMQGEPVRHLVWLQSGMAKHAQVSSEGKEVLLRISGCGDVLNVHGQMVSRFHTCSSRVLESAEALVWEYDQVDRLCVRYPRFRSNLDRLLVIQLEELEERFREIATETVARRLAFLLVRLCNQVGRRSVQGLRVSLSREELAQMAGISVYTTCRLLVRWAQQGILLADRQKIVVNDIERLSLVKAVEMFR